MAKMKQKRLSLKLQLEANNTSHRSFSEPATNQIEALITNDRSPSLLQSVERDHPTQPQQRQQLEDKLLTYENSSFGYKIEYPRDWIIVNEYERVPNFKNLQLGMLFFFLSRGILADYNSTFWIETEYLPNRFMPLDRFADSKIEGLYKGQANILSRDTINIAGQTAERIELSCCDSNQSLHETRIFLIVTFT